MRNINNFVQRYRPKIIGILIGFFLGGMIGVGLVSLYIWQNPPLYAGGALPNELTPNYQDHYLAIVVDSYLLDGNVDLTLERLQTFDQAAKDKVLDRLAQYQGDSSKSEAVTALVNQLSQEGASEFSADQTDEANALSQTTTPATPSAGVNLSALLITLVSIASVFVILFFLIWWIIGKFSRKTPKYVIGLDFGTTMSRIVCMRRDLPDGKLPEMPPKEKPAAVRSNKEESAEAKPNEDLPEIIWVEMPTAVIPKLESETEPGTDPWAVGKDAIDKGVENPLFKLAMGKLSEVPVNSPDMEKPKCLRPEYLAAKLMRELHRKICDKVDALGETKYVTVTVPFESTYLQREATRFSAKVAGWDNIVTLPEPVAAFLYFQYKSKKLEDSDKYFLVFDFGGGTCDISIIYREKKDSLPYVITGSTAKIGGEKIDEYLGEPIPYVITRSTADMGGEKIDESLGRTKKDEKSWNELTPREKFNVRQKIKGWKEKINPAIESAELISEIKQRSQKNDPGNLSIPASKLKDRFIGFSLRPKDLDKVVEDKVNPEIEKALVRALKGAKKIKSGFCIDKVLLVGGSSQLWTVRKFIEEYFENKEENKLITFEKPKILLEEKNLMETVVYGAALHQYYRSRGKTAIYSTLSKNIYLRYQKDNKVSRDTVWHTVLLGKQGERLPKPDENLTKIQGFFFRLRHSLKPLRLPSNIPDGKETVWSIYQDNIVTGRSPKEIARIELEPIRKWERRPQSENDGKVNSAGQVTTDRDSDKNKYKPGLVTYLRVVYRINQYGDLDLLAPYLVNTQDRIEPKLLRQPYDFDHKREEQIRREMNIL